MIKLKNISKSFLFLEFFIFKFSFWNKFLFITKQGFFIFLDKLSKVIEVKKVLTKLCNKNETFKNLNAFKNWDI